MKTITVVATQEADVVTLWVVGTFSHRRRNESIIVDAINAFDEVFGRETRVARFARIQDSSVIDSAGPEQQQAVFEVVLE